MGTNIMHLTALYFGSRELGSQKRKRLYIFYYDHSRGDFVSKSVYIARLRVNT